ncbi:MAG TPA: NAD-dependent epimerase/dehydratase family protein [Polyangia bacterium]|nr:NAD-dependent epimerase/dehydratase family protein [Polyangia bacterium]
MKVIVVGASGMVGQGVLRECLLDPDVERVLVVGRRAIGKTDAKLVERTVPDLTDLSSLEGELAGYDACFFCLGVTSAGLKEPEYRKVTYDITAAFAAMLARQSPGLTFVFVSGRGTDSTEKGPIMWARVKGAAENVVLNAGFKAVYLFRPGIIQPLHGARSRTAAYRFLYVVLTPLVWLLKAVTPGSITTTERVGVAMLEAARRGAPKTILENADINALALAARRG